MIQFVEFNYTNWTLTIVQLACCISHYYINPFLPTGQFLTPKVIIIIKCLIDILLFKVLL